MFYTQEQIKRLEKYRKSFETAVHSGFARNVGSIALKDIEEIYDEALGHHYNYNSGCSVCVLQFIKRVGEPFLKEAEKYKKKAEEEEKKRIEEENAAIREDMELIDRLVDKGILQPTDNEPVMVDIVEEEPAVHMKDGTITFNFDKALEEEAEIKEQPIKKTRTRKKKEDGTN